MHTFEEWKKKLIIVRGGGDIATGTIYKLHQSRFPVLVLEIANITVGAIWIRFLKNGYGYINDTIPELCMSLLKDFRNQGLGSLLIKRMLDDIKSLGYRHISLSVSKDNYAAGWYRKLGFKVYKEQKEDYIMIVDL